MIGSALYSLEIETVLSFYNTSYFNYDELPNYNSIHDVFEPHNNFRIINVSSDKKKKEGHWIAIFRRNDNLIEYFDSKGLPPDIACMFTNKLKVNKNKRYYTELLAKTPEIRTLYNTVKLQKDRTNTCGKWVLSRILSMGTPLDTYVKMMNNITGDKDVFINRLYTIPRHKIRD